MTAKGQFQIGKFGVTDGVIESLKLHFINRKTVKVSILRGSLKGREEVKKMAGELINKLGPNYDCTIIGFTITIRKHSKKIR